MHPRMNEVEVIDSSQLTIARRVGLIATLSWAGFLNVSNFKYLRQVL